MGSEPRADDHRGPSFRIPPVVIVRKQAWVRADDPSDNRKSHDASVQVSRERQVCTPSGIGVEITRMVGEKDVERIRLSLPYSVRYGLRVQYFADWSVKLCPLKLKPRYVERN